MIRRLLASRPEEVLVADPQPTVYGALEAQGLVVSRRGLISGRFYKIEPHKLMAIQRRYGK